MLTNFVHFNYTDITRNLPKRECLLTRRLFTSLELNSRYSILLGFIDNLFNVIHANTSLI